MSHGVSLLASRDLVKDREKMEDLSGKDDYVNQEEKQWVGLG